MITKPRAFSSAFLAAINKPEKESKGHINIFNEGKKSSVNNAEELYKILYIPTLTAVAPSVHL